MSRIQMLRLLVNERLTAAAEEIFGVFERTIEDYEDEINHQRKRLDALKPEIRTDSFPTQLLVCEEEVHPEQQERSPSLLHRLEQPDVIELTLCPDSMKCENNGENNQSYQLSQTQDPGPLQIKEEQEELLQDLEEEDDGSRITELPLKREDGQEKTRSQSFQSLQTQREKNREAYCLPSTSTEQMKIEPDGEDWGVSEPASNFYADGDLEPTRDGQLFSSDCYRTETDNSDDWEESEEPQSGLKTQKIHSSNSRTLKRSMELSHELKSSSHILSTPRCKVCGTCFLDKVSLMLHIFIHSSDCGLCGKHLDPSESLEPHLESHSTVCGKVFTKNIDLGATKRSNSGEKPFICGDCGKGFEWRTHLQTHMRMHTGEKPFSCSVCGKGFSRKTSLQTHMRSHTGEKPFSCSVCGKGFSRKTSLQTHMRSHTGEKPFSCSVCGKAFTRKETVKMHMRSHTGEKLFSCSVCGKEFSEKGGLKSHMRTHTGEKPFSCSVCGKGFSEKGNLKKHMRLHTGEKPFICSVCGNGFRHKGNLKKHMRIHTGEKPFSCSVCSKTFAQKGTVKMHMLTHTGEKPFSCSVCGKGYSKKEHLKIHMRGHTGDKPFSCSVCGKGFSEKGSCKRHMVTHLSETL